MALDDFTLARVLHVAAIVGWIGGVWFVTLVVMPAVRRNEPPERLLKAFHLIEAGFAPQARLWVLIAGASGFWMVWRGDLWWRFADAQYWWMGAMVGLWLIFMAMLFLAEPLFLHRRMSRSPMPERDFRRMELLHRLLSLAALVTVLGAMAGAHGMI